MSYNHEEAFALIEKLILTELKDINEILKTEYVMDSLKVINKNINILEDTRYNLGYYANDLQFFKEEN